MILETVVGTNGIIVPPDGYLQSIREVCDRHGILLISDEVMAGFGRTGKWFACENWDVVPDILTVAKGINSGYVPLGAMIVARADRRLGARQVLRRRAHLLRPPARLRRRASPRSRRSSEEGIVENAAEMGDRVRARSCATLQERHPSIGDVRGLGCFWGLELVKNRETREPLVPVQRDRRGGRAGRRVWRRRRSSAGLYLMTHWNVVMVCPPLTITREELDEGLAILDEALAIADEYTV